MAIVNRGRIIAGTFWIFALQKGVLSFSTHVKYFVPGFLERPTRLLPLDSKATNKRTLLVDLDYEKERSPHILNLDLEQQDEAIMGMEDDSFIQDKFERGSSDDTLLELPKSASETTRPRVFPLSQIVNHEPLKQALILAATNPRLGAAGVLIGGGHGTCKSVLARSTINLFPRTMERIKNNPFNIEPLSRQSEKNKPLELDSFLKESFLKDSFADQSALESTESIATPFVTVPLNVQEESLLGSVDIEQSMLSGRTAFSPGLLAKAHRGILYVDDIHLLEDDIANILMNALADGCVTVEREGLSVQYPCRPRLVVATCNPEEGDLRDHIVDRFATFLSSDATPLSVEERVQAVQNVEGFHPGQTIANNKDSDMLQLGRTIAAKDSSDDEILENVLQAQELLPHVQISSDQIQYLCEQATRAECKGQRAELFATEVAKTVAALCGRSKVNKDDLQYGIGIAIAPRAQVPFFSDEQDVAEETEVGQQQQQQPTTELQPLEPEMDLPSGKDEHDDEEEEANEETDQVDNKDDDTKGGEDEEMTEDEELEIEIPKEFMFGVDFDIPIDSSLLQFQHSLTRKGKGGKRAKIFSLSRGRFVKAIFPKAGTRMGRLAIGATLRAAAPHQKLRKQRQHDKKKSHVKVSVTKDDFRIQRMARKAGTLVVFVVDASGSMALNRMGAAKGAAMLLLKEAYKCRDKIALIAFHGKEAQVIVPPTKSMAMTKNRLESMPCGGGSPLAHAIETAVRVGLNEIKVKRDVGKVILVLLTDGRANVPLGVSRGEETDNPDLVNGISSDRKLLREEVIALAKQVSALSDLDLLCIDTEDQFVGTGIARDATKAAMGTYHHLVGASDTKTITHLVQEGVKEAKS